MSINVRLTGSDELLKKLEKLSEDYRRELKASLTAAAMSIDNDAKQSIQRGSKTGRWYGNHRASAPGEAPATMTGRLVNSIEFDVDDQTLEAVIGTNLDYGRYLELGTVDIAPRPWLFPAFEQNRDRFIRDVVTRLNSATRRKGE